MAAATQSQCQHGLVVVLEASAAASVAASAAASGVVVEVDSEADLTVAVAVAVSVVALAVAEAEAASEAAMVLEVIATASVHQAEHRQVLVGLTEGMEIVASNLEAAAVHLMTDPAVGSEMVVVLVVGTVVGTVVDAPAATWSPSASARVGIATESLEIVTETAGVTEVVIVVIAATVVIGIGTDPGAAETLTGHAMMTTGNEATRAVATKIRENCVVIKYLTEYGMGGYKPFFAGDGSRKAKAERRSQPYVQVHTSWPA